MFKSNYLDSGMQSLYILQPKSLSKSCCWFKPSLISKIFRFVFKVFVLIAAISLTYWLCNIVIGILEELVTHTITSVLEAVYKTILLPISR
jgi:hypothetical protein